MISIEPVFKTNYCTIAFAINDKYTPYLAVTLKSLLLNSNDNNNYDILIFSKDISENNKKILKIMADRKNVSIRFIDMKELFTQTMHLTAGHITEETYFRLIMPDILNKYQKFLYLDADLIILDDVYKLYSMDMMGHPLAASEECLFSALINLCDKQEREYFLEKLGIENLDSYFQAGVLLFDVKQYVKNDLAKVLMERAKSFDYHMMDQDILNEEFNKSYIRFDVDWNYAPLQQHMIDKHYEELMSPVIRSKYQAVKNPKIIHYADRRKPWLFPAENMAYIWWEYARKTPFYEELLLRMAESNAMNKSGETQILHMMEVMNNMPRFKRKRFFYRNMKHLCSGNLQKKFKEKYDRYNAEIKSLQAFMKNI